MVCRRIDPRVCHLQERPTPKQGGADLLSELFVALVAHWFSHRRFARLAACVADFLLVVRVLVLLPDAVVFEAVWPLDVQGDSCGTSDTESLGSLSAIRFWLGFGPGRPGPGVMLG